MGTQNIEQARSLIAELQGEFDRPVPESYAPLIKRSLDSVHPIFFNLDQQLAPRIIGEIDTNPEHKARFARAIVGKDFIDIGCGEPETHVQARGRMKYPSVAAFAQALGASRYIGVDRYQVEDERRGIFTGEDEKGFRRVYLGGLDFLEFLSKIPDANKHPTGKFFFISGLESTFGESLRNSEDSKVIGKYHDYLYDEFARATKRGDVVYLGPRTKSLRPEELVKRGFRGSLGLDYAKAIKEGWTHGMDEGCNRLDFLTKE